MYPVRLNFEQVLQRIEALLNNGHHAEALVTSMFTLEKLIKRSLRRAIVARGFSITQSNKILARNGFDALVAQWDVFDRRHRTLPSILQAEWSNVKQAKKMRNDLVHGNKVFDLAECQSKATEVLIAIRKLHAFIVEDYGSDPWQKQPAHRARLDWQL